MLKTEVMVDLETMGLGATAAIIQIGAVHFDAKRILHRFCANVALQSSIAYGMTVDEETQDWWRCQAPEACSAFRGTTVSLPKALQALRGWMAGLPGWHEDGGLWSKGPAFDAAILEYAFRLLGHDETPWSYRAVRDQRTLVGVARELGWEEPFWPEPTHDALADCELQVEQVQAAWAFIQAQTKPVAT